jgi:uncharacterized protein (TIGR02246 family)
MGFELSDPVSKARTPEVKGNEELRQKSHAARRHATAARPIPLRDKGVKGEGSTKREGPSTMSLRSTLDLHLSAIKGRNLESLAATLHPDDVLLVTAAGDVRFGTDAFLSTHRDWFESPSWTLDTEVLHVREGADLATVLLRLRYRDGDVDEPSILSLVFRRDGDRWLMVQDQNTPVR